MQITYTAAEVKCILLDHANDRFRTNFDDVTFDGYSAFRTATLSRAETPAEIPAAATFVQVPMVREVNTEEDFLS